MSAQLAREAWASLWPECEPLMRAHRKELDPEGEARVGWEPRTDVYEALDAAGALVAIGARAEGMLVGYCIWTLGPGLDGPGLTATQGPWFVEPAFRQGPLGLRLFAESLRALRAAGVTRAFPHHWANSPPALARYFRSLGATPLETVYSLWLGDA